MAFVLTLFGYWSVISSIGSRYFAIDVTGTGSGLFSPWFAVELFIIQLLLGIIVGAVSSYLATKRHLRV